MQCLLPSQRYRSVFDIPLQELIASGIKGIIFDLDNTLTEWNKELSNETIDWLKFAKKIGFKMCFVSNNSDLRVRELADIAEVPFVARAGKPRPGCFRRAI
jgi:HAD superfamily phosphatase (TIGR01668 family)